MEQYVTKKELVLFTSEVINVLRHEITPLMMILQESQQRFGCVPMEVQLLISKEMNVSTAKINGVVSFYSMFSLTPNGRNTIGVCTGTACYVKGSGRLVDRVSDMLGVPYGETTDDGEWTMADTRCVGDCSNAPIIMVNEDIHQKVSSDDVPKIINQYKKK